VKLEKSQVLNFVGFLFVSKEKGGGLEAVAVHEEKG